MNKTEQKAGGSKSSPCNLFSRAVGYFRNRNNGQDDQIQRTREEDIRRALDTLAAPAIRIDAINKFKTEPVVLVSILNAFLRYMFSFGTSRDHYQMITREIREPEQSIIRAMVSPLEDSVTDLTYIPALVVVALSAQNKENGFNAVRRLQERKNLDIPDKWWKIPEYQGIYKTAREFNKKDEIRADVAKAALITIARITRDVDVLHLVSLN